MIKLCLTVKTEQFLKGLNWFKTKRQKSTVEMMDF